MHPCCAPPVRAATVLLASNPREVYVPPPRVHLLGPSGQGDTRPASADMAHLGPPRPASADTPRSSSRLLNSSGEGGPHAPISSPAHPLSPLAKLLLQFRPLALILLPKSVNARPTTLHTSQPLRGGPAGS